MNRAVMIEELRGWAKQLRAADDHEWARSDGRAELHGLIHGVTAGMEEVAKLLEEEPLEWLWALAIRHRHGDDVSLYRGEPEATAALVEFCRSWWDETNLEPLADDADPDEIIERYFDAMSFSESYSISQAKVN